jgi:hypothetical protein
MHGALKRFSPISQSYDGVEVNFEMALINLQRGRGLGMTLTEFAIEHHHNTFSFIDNRVCFLMTYLGSRQHIFSNHLNAL